MTSATDELRRLLDERGVEHYDGTECTLWGYEQTSDSTGVYRYAADEVADGMMHVRLYNLTPEQAVDATLGRGTCRDTALEGEWFACSECNTELRVHEPFGVICNIRYCPNCGRRVIGDVDAN